MKKISFIFIVTIFCSWILITSCKTKIYENKKLTPNILIAVADDISYPHIGAYGCSWINTPACNRVAENGIIFTNAYTPNAKSAPSRACILTGRNSWQLEEACNHFPNFPIKFKTFMEVLKENGYHTGYTAKGWSPGKAIKENGELRELTGKNYSNLMMETPTAGIEKFDYASNFDVFLNDRNEDKPFCFWYGSYEPHRPYEYGTGVKEGRKKKSDIDKVYGFWPDNDAVRNDMLDYALEIEYFDKHLAKMLEKLESIGELENTIVIVLSDNGMPFPRIKGQAYEHSNHLPLMIMWGKGINNPGRYIHNYISFIDIAPTLLEAANIDQLNSGMQKIEGTSFMDIFRSKNSGLISNKRDYVLIGKERHDVGRPDDVGYPIRGIVKGDFLFVKNFKIDRWPAGNPETGYLNCDASPTKSNILNLKREKTNEYYWSLSFGKRVDEELYNITEDPDCINNLIKEKSYFYVKENLKNQLIKELINQDDPRILGKGNIFDKYEYTHLKTKDFYNRYMKGQLSKTSASWVDSKDFEIKPIN